MKLCESYQARFMFDIDFINENVFIFNKKKSDKLYNISFLLFKQRRRKIMKKLIQISICLMILISSQKLL